MSDNKTQLQAVSFCYTHRTFSMQVEVLHRNDARLTSKTKLACLTCS